MLGCNARVYTNFGTPKQEKKNPISLYTRVRVESCWGVMLGCTAIMGRQNKEKKKPLSLYTRVRVQ